MEGVIRRDCTSADANAVCSKKGAGFIILRKAAESDTFSHICCVVSYEPVIYVTRRADTI